MIPSLRTVVTIALGLTIYLVIVYPVFSAFQSSVHKASQPKMRSDSGVEETTDWKKGKETPGPFFGLRNIKDLLFLATCWICLSVAIIFFFFGTVEQNYVVASIRVRTSLQVYVLEVSRITVPRGLLASASIQFENVNDNAID